MLTIEKTMNRTRYDVRIKGKGIRSTPTYCKTSEEITACVAHYYGDTKNHNKEICPFCKE